MTPQRVKQYHRRTYASIYICMHVHIYMLYTYVHNLQRMCHRCVRWCQRNICITHTTAHALVLRTPVKCTQHSLQKKHMYIYVHTCAYAYISTRIHIRIYDTVQTRWRTAPETHNLGTNMHVHTYKHVYTCNVYTYIYTCIYIHIYMSVHIHTCTYVHTHVQHVHMHAHKHVRNDGAAATAREARLDAKKLSPSPWPLQSRGGLPSVASSPIARPRGMIDQRRTTTTNSSSSHHHDSTPPRLQPLICTGADLHWCGADPPSSWPAQAWPWPPETRLRFCHSRGFSIFNNKNNI